MDTDRQRENSIPPSPHTHQQGNSKPDTTSINGRIINLHSMFRVFVVRMKKLCSPWLSKMCEVKTLRRLCEYAVCSESSFGANVRGYVFWRCGSNILCCHTKTRLFKYIEDFTTKKGKFSDKKFWYFSNSCTKQRLWVLVRTASARRF